MSGVIPPLTNTPSWHGAQLKHRDKFTFTFTQVVEISQVFKRYILAIPEFILYSGDGM
jgi:hypothetical protein